MVVQTANVIGMDGSITWTEESTARLIRTDASRRPLVLATPPVKTVKYHLEPQQRSDGWWESNETHVIHIQLVLLRALYTSSMYSC